MLESERWPLLLGSQGSEFPRRSEEGWCQSHKSRLSERLVEGRAFWNILILPIFLTQLIPLHFLCRRPPHWGGGHPGAGHGKPHHLRCDCPALRRLCLCSQQAWHPGEEDSPGSAGGTRYGAAKPLLCLFSISALCQRPVPSLTPVLAPT